MTTDKSNSPLPAPIDVTDPWRGLYQATRLPAPTEYGDIAHPDIPCWPDDREEALDKLVQAQGFDFQVVAGEFTEAALEEGDELYWAEMRAWTPVAPPEGEWRLAWKGDTEDGPYAWFVRPMALRPEPVALTATGKQQVGEAQGDTRAQFEAYRGGNFQRDAQGYYMNARTAQDWAMWQAALAARQPGAQVPVGEVYQGSARLPQARLSKPLPIGSLLYAAPPAQGIELGQCPVVEWQQHTVGGWHAISQSRYDDYARRKTMGERVPETRALIDQRDAAPGVWS